MTRIIEFIIQNLMRTRRDIVVDDTNLPLENLTVNEADLSEMDSLARARFEYCRAHIDHEDAVQALARILRAEGSPAT